MVIVAGKVVSFEDSMFNLLIVVRGSIHTNDQFAGDRQVPSIPAKGLPGPALLFVSEVSLSHSAADQYGEFPLLTGQKKRVSGPRWTRLPFRSKWRTSLRCLSRISGGRPSGFIRNGQFLSSFSTPATEDQSPLRIRHALAKTVFVSPFPSTRLISPFHSFSIRFKPKI